jgi:hypothetical protein
LMMATFRLALVTSVGVSFIAYNYSGALYKEYCLININLPL